MKTNFLIRRLVFSALLIAGIAVPICAQADAIRILSDSEFRSELVKMTGKYDRDVTPQGAARNPYISERLIVKSYDGSLDPDEYGAIDAIRDRDGHYILQFSSAAEARRAERNLEKEESVLYVEPDLIFFVQEEIPSLQEVLPSSLQDAQLSSLQEAKPSFAEALQSPSFQAQAPSNWGTTYTGCDVYADYAGKNASAGSIAVAVIDTGIRKTHELFRGRISSSREYDFVHGDQDASDDIGHGTRVAGIIVECTPGLDQVKLISVKALDSKGEGSLSQVQQAIRLIAGKNSKGNYYKYADVINLSFVSEKAYQNSSVLQEELGEAARAGAVVVLAAGNQGEDSLVHPPANVSDATVPGSLVTASCDQNGNPAYRSNYGSSVDICAPGMGIVTASGSSDNGYDSVSGTSFAAPHVSAAAAMLKLVEPSLSASAAESRLESCVKPLSSTNGRFYGAGILDMTKGIPESYYAESVIALINSLPASISLSNQSAVEAARNAYDALTDRQKARVTNLSTLIAAEQRINELIIASGGKPGNSSKDSNSGTNNVSGPHANVSYTVPMKKKQKSHALRVLGLTGSDRVVSWTSSDNSRVQVRGNVNGTCLVIAGKKTGKAVITARCASGKNVTFSVKVQKKAVRTKKLSIQPKQVTLRVGETCTLAPELYPVTSSDKIRYTSKKKRVVSVSKSGVLKARSKGSSVIVIRSGKKTTKVKVTVVAN